MPLRTSILLRFCLQFNIAGQIVYSFLQSPPFPLHGDITITLHSSSEIPFFKHFLIFYLPNKKPQGPGFPLYRGILHVMETYQKK